MIFKFQVESNYKFKTYILDSWNFWFLKDRNHITLPKFHHLFISI